MFYRAYLTMLWSGSTVQLTDAVKKLTIQIRIVIISHKIFAKQIIQKSKKMALNFKVGPNKICIRGLSLLSQFKKKKEKLIYAHEK